MPGKSVPDINEDSLRTLLEAQGLSVHSIAFDSPGGSDTKRFAYVRLTPQPPPWLAKSEPAAEVLPPACTVASTSTVGFIGLPLPILDTLYGTVVTVYAVWRKGVVTKLYAGSFHEDHQHHSCHTGFWKMITCFRSCGERCDVECPAHCGGAATLSVARN